MKLRIQELAVLIPTLPTTGPDDVDANLAAYREAFTYRDTGEPSPGLALNLAYVHRDAAEKYLQNGNIEAGMQHAREIDAFAAGLEDPDARNAVRNGLADLFTTYGVSPEALQAPRADDFGPRLEHPYSPTA